MANQQVGVTSWRSQMRGWLESVVWHHRVVGVDLKTAAMQNQGGVPNNAWVKILGQVIRDVVVWYVKGVIRDVASAAGIDLDDEATGILADMAVTAMTTAP